MRILQVPIHPSQRKHKDPEEMLGHLRTDIEHAFDVVRLAANGLLGFGDGVDADNMKGVWVTYTTNATPDTEDTIDHNTGQVPLGYFVFRRDKGGVLYDGGTTWTSSQLFLKCTVASMTVTMFVLLPSQNSDS